MKACDFFLVNFSEMEDVEKLTPMPAICLLALSEPLDEKSLFNAVSYFLSFGAFWFMSYGEFAEKIEDSVDSAIEMRESFDVVTTAHTSDELEDVADFILNTASVGMTHFRCFLIFDNQEKNRVFCESLAKKYSAGLGLIH